MYGGKSGGDMSYDDFFNTGIGKEILEKEAEYVAENIEGTAASIGCGTGIIEERIMEIGRMKIIGIDVDDEMLYFARKRIDVIKADSSLIPLKDSSVDGVIFITSLEFMDDYRKSIEEAERILKRNGRIVAIILNTSSSYFKSMYQKKGYLWKNIKHINVGKIEEYLMEKFDIKKKPLFGIEDGKFVKDGDAVYGFSGLIR